MQGDAAAVAHVPEHACLFAQTVVAHRGELAVDDVDGVVVVPSGLRSHVPALLLPERLVVADGKRGGPVTVDVFRTVGVDARLGIVAVSHGYRVVRLAEESGKFKTTFVLIVFIICRKAVFGRALQGAVSQSLEKRLAVIVDVEQVKIVGRRPVEIIRYIQPMESPVTIAVFPTITIVVSEKGSKISVTTVDLLRGAGIAERGVAALDFRDKQNLSGTV